MAENDNQDQQDAQSAPEKFCASPWVEGVLRTANADTKICCKNPTSLGSWAGGRIASSWLSPVANRMREEIAAGRYPDNFCRTCHQNNTSMKLSQLLNKPLHEYIRLFSRKGGADLPVIQNLKALFDKTAMDDGAARVLSEFHALRQRHLQLARENGWEEHALACEKLGVIAEITEDFLNGEPKPRHVAPFRQITLIAVCNARCVHCKGLFTGEIDEGIPQPDGTNFRWMNLEEFEVAMANSESVIDYFTNGSETLFHKEWQAVAKRLRQEGVRLRISTNGMLLTPDHVDAMLDNDYVGKLNISLDGATPETIENIRVRVKYDRVMRNIDYLLEKLHREQIHLPISFSFVIMKENCAEIPLYLDLVNSFWKGRDVAKPVVMFQPLSQIGPDTYGEFIRAHHHSLFPEDELKAAFESAAEKATEYGITTFVFNNRRIQDFVADGARAPRLNFQIAVVNLFEEEA